MNDSSRPNISFLSDHGKSEMIYKNYLYYGPGKAMKKIYHEFRSIVKNIFSSSTQQEIVDNIDAFNFLISVLPKLNKLPFSTSEKKVLDVFKSNCFRLLERVLQAYPFGDVTGYGNAASHFYNQLHLLQPEKLDVEDLISMGEFSPLDQVLSTALDVGYQVERFFDRKSKKKSDVHDNSHGRDNRKKT